MRQIKAGREGLPPPSRPYAGASTSHTTVYYCANSYYNGFAAFLQGRFWGCACYYAVWGSCILHRFLFASTGRPRGTGLSSPAGRAVENKNRGFGEEEAHGKSMTKHYPIAVMFGMDCQFYGPKMKNFLQASIILFLWAFLCPLGCPFYRLYHIQCPGCGLTRAWISFLRGDWKGALQYHLLFFPAPLLIILFAYKSMVPQRKQKVVNLLLYTLSPMYLIYHLFRIVFL